VQKKRGVKRVEKKKLKCAGCAKEFVRKDFYTKHIESCKHHLRKINTDLQEEINGTGSLQEELRMARAEISVLQGRLEEREKRIEDLKEAAAHPVNNTYNTCNTTFNLVQDHFEPLTEELLSESSKHMHITHLRDGGEAMANLALNTTLNSDWRLLVTDLARKKSMFKDCNDSVTKDTEACGLIQRWCASNVAKALDLYDELVEDVKKDNLTAAEYSEYMLPYITNLAHMRSAATGKDFQTPFCKGFAKITLAQKSTPGSKALMARAPIRIEEADPVSPSACSDVTIIEFPDTPVMRPHMVNAQTQTYWPMDSPYHY
jgi:hypothetical protein